MLGSTKRAPVKPSNQLELASVRNFKGGLNTFDPPLTMNSSYIIEGRNVYPEPNGQLRVRFGTTLVGDASSVGDNIIAMEYFINALILVMANGNVVAMNSNGVPTTIWSAAIAATRSGAPAGWSGGLTFASFAQFGGSLVIVNGVDKPLIVSPQLVVNYLADLGSNSNINTPRARYVIAHNNYLVMAVTPTDTTKLYIASKGTSGTFYGDTAPNDALVFDIATYVTHGLPEITGLGSFRDRLIVCTAENILAVQLGIYGAATSHTPNVEDVIDNYGAVSHRCMIPTGDDFLFMDKVGIASLQRAIISSTLSPTRESLLVSRDLQKAIARFTPAQLSANCWAVHDRIGQQLLFCLPKTAPVATVWNVNDKSGPATLSADALSVTGAGSASAVLIRATRGTGVGQNRRYFQVDFNAVSTKNAGAGVCQADATVANIAASAGTKGIGVATATGTVIINGVSSSTVLGAMQGKKLEVCIDRWNNRAWFRRANLDGSNQGFWNNSVAAEPATNSGGLNISGLTGDLFPCALVPNSDTADTYTANFGFSWFTVAGVPYTITANYVPIDAMNSLPDWAADNDVYVFCLDRSQKFRAMAYFDSMPYRCAARSSDSRVFMAQGTKVYYYRNQYEPLYVDMGAPGSQPWSDNTLFSDATGFTDTTSAALSTYDGNPITFAISTPWSEMKKPDVVKHGRYLHCLMEGVGSVTIEQFNDRFSPAQLSLTLNQTLLPDTPDHVTRPLNNDQLYAWNSTFTRARLRVSGVTKQALSLLSLGLLYLPGTYRR